MAALALHVLTYIVQEFVSLLLRHDALVDETDSAGLTALHYAVHQESNKVAPRA